MAIIDPIQGQGAVKAISQKEQRDQQKGRGHGGKGAGQHRPKRQQGNRSSIRKPVLALCKVTRADAAGDATEALKAALLEAERGNEPVDGGLLGMAAAQAGRLGLKDLLASLMAYAWPRLSFCGGREVAELAAAASKCGCDDDRFFYFVAAYCSQNPSAFTCLRDVALVAAALTPKLDSQVEMCKDSITRSRLCRLFAIRRLYGCLTLQQQLRKKMSQSRPSRPELFRS